MNYRELCKSELYEKAVIDNIKIVHNKRCEAKDYNIILYRVELLENLFCRNENNVKVINPIITHYLTFYCEVCKKYFYRIIKERR